LPAFMFLSDRQYKIVHVRIKIGVKTIVPGIVSPLSNTTTSNKKTVLIERLFYFI
jgi:hypothetical protein